MLEIFGIHPSAYRYPVPTRNLERDELELVLVRVVKSSEFGGIKSVYTRKSLQSPASLNHLFFKLNVMLKNQEDATFIV